MDRLALEDALFVHPCWEFEKAVLDIFFEPFICKGLIDGPEGIINLK
jgi:hypothetical protein